MIELCIDNDQSDIVLPDELNDVLIQLTEVLYESEQLQAGEVSLLIVDNEQIRDWNAQYRGLDKPTDVLSFAIQEEHDEESKIVYDESDDGELMPFLYGDIVISAERAREQADDFGHSLLRELCFLYVHGFLHLIGYDHQNEEQEREMIGKQNFVLEKVGILR